MLSVKVSSKYQISVPSEIRARLGIKAGDRLTVEVKDEGVFLRPRPARASERLTALARGMYGDRDAVDVVRDLREASERVGRRWG